MKKIFCAVVFMFFVSPFFSLGAGIQFSANPLIISSAGVVKGTSLKGSLSENAASTVLEDSASPTFAIGESISGTFKMERIPIIISGGIDLFYYAEVFNFGANLSADYLFFENQIVNILNWYCGTGLTGSVFFDKDFHTALTGGFRFLLGLNWHFFDGYMELYVQEVVSPNVMYNVSSKTSTLALQFPLEIGIRLHF